MRCVLKFHWPITERDSICCCYRAARKWRPLVYYFWELAWALPRMLSFSNTEPISPSWNGVTRQHFRRGAGLERLPYLIAGRLYWKGCQPLLDYLHCDWRRAAPDPIVSWEMARLGWAECFKYWCHSVYKADSSSLGMQFKCIMHCLRGLMTLHFVT